MKKFCIHTIAFWAVLTFAPLSSSFGQDQESDSVPEAVEDVVVRVEDELLASVGVSGKDLEGAQVHVAGIYRPSDDNHDDRVFVDVEPLGTPAVIVLSAYMETFWHLRLAEEADVRLVVVSGYFNQTLEIVGDRDVPVLRLSHFQEGNDVSGKRLWAYAYAWNTEEGRKLARLIFELTGKTVTTFQGHSEARLIEIDGEKGRLSVRESKGPIPGLLTDEERRAEPIVFPDKREESADVSSSEQPSAAELIASEAGMRIELIELQAKITELNRQLSEAQEKIELLVTRLKNNDSKESRDELRDVLEERFALDHDVQSIRVKIASTKLQLVLARQMLRVVDRDKIIENQLRGLLAE